MRVRKLLKTFFSSSQEGMKAQDRALPFAGEPHERRQRTLADSPFPTKKNDLQATPGRGPNFVLQLGDFREPPHKKLHWDGLAWRKRTVIFAHVIFTGQRKGLLVHRANRRV